VVERGSVAADVETTDLRSCWRLDRFDKLTDRSVLKQPQVIILISMEVIMGTVDVAPEQERKPQMGLTFEDVWAAFMESDREFQKSKEEHDRMIAEHDWRFEEYDRMSKERKEEQDRRAKEHDRIFKELADEELKELQRQTGGSAQKFWGLGGTSGRYGEEGDAKGRTVCAYPVRRHDEPREARMVFTQ
jgi:hypothetical protein